MRRNLFVASAVLMALGISAGSSARADDESLQVMTFNLKYADETSSQPWSRRRPVMQALLEHASPDVFGTQEGLYDQLRDLDEDLVDYDWIGLGRDGGSRGEFMAVFYRRERLDPVAYDHYWLSDTPDVIGSTTWGNTNRRMVTWVRFRDRATDREFYFINTHFDHRVQTAREKSAALVLERTRELDADVPKILVGDFNARAGENPAYDVLVGEDAFVDTWTTAAQRGPEIGTFGGYREPVAGGPRIDWILTRGSVQCRWTEIIAFRRGDQYPSDHYPVVARLDFVEAAPESR